MSKIVHALLLTWILSVPNIALAESQISVGVGLGSMYSGLGVNVSLYEDNNIKYLSYGCFAFETDTNGNKNSACGLGLGFLKSGILSEGNKHTVGLHFGAIAAKRSWGQNGDSLLDTVYGIGIPYAFFPNGLSGKGLNVGITPSIGNYKGDALGKILLQIGYQF